MFFQVWPCNFSNFVDFSKFFDIFRKNYIFLNIIINIQLKKRGKSHEIFKLILLSTQTHYFL